MTKTMMGIAFTIVTALASPAFAQSGPINQWNAYDAYAQSGFGGRSMTTNSNRHSPRASWDVYDTYSHYVGSDPDPNVRDMIARDRVEQPNGGY